MPGGIRTHITAGERPQKHTLDRAATGTALLLAIGAQIYNSTFLQSPVQTGGRYWNTNWISPLICGIATWKESPKHFPTLVTNTRMWGRAKTLGALVCVSVWARVFFNRVICAPPYPRSKFVSAPKKKKECGEETLWLHSFFPTALNEGVVNFTSCPCNFALTK